ncbi:MAG: preprotein translocase subunit YajC [Oscillospiraceae bacterium]|nr:preprotein translocase subunit YajC [Oscillospiraceae bacterium]
MEIWGLLTPPADQPPPDMLGMLLQMAIWIVPMIALIYFVMIRPEKKRKAKMDDLLSNLQIADEVVTAGGIIGRVIDAKPDSDTIVIETGGDKTRIRILRKYIIENRTVHDDV